MKCPRCRSFLIDIKGGIDGKVEYIVYSCKSCGAWRELFQPKKSFQEILNKKM